jgi:acyl-CoA dehydrogenase
VDHVEETNYEHGMVADAARAILERPGVDPDPWARIREGGWSGIAVSEEAGGQGGTLAHAVAVAEAAGHSAVAAPVVEAILAALLIAACEGADELLADVVAGGVRASLLPSVVNVDDPGGWSCAPGVPWGRAADVLLVLTCADRRDYRLRCLSPAELDLTPGETLAGDPLDRVAPGSVRAAGPRDGYPLREPLSGLVAAAALLTAARLLGAMRAAGELSVGYAVQRRQFGRPIGAFQAVAHMLVEQSGWVELAAAALGAATHTPIAAEHDACAAAARSIASGGAAPVARIAHQVHGAIGTTREHALHRSTLRLADWRDAFGTARWWRQRAGRRTLVDDSWWDDLAPR